MYWPCARQRLRNRRALCKSSSDGGGVGTDSWLVRLSSVRLFINTDSISAYD